MSQDMSKWKGLQVVYRQVYKLINKLMLAYLSLYFGPLESITFTRVAWSLLLTT